MKKLLALLIFAESLLSLFAEGYRIDGVDYDLKGQTRKYALETAVPADRTKIFETEDELMAYIKDFEMKINNTRAFDSVAVDFTVAEPDDDGVSGVRVSVSAEDSHHLLVVPYPKYDSNTGFKLKLKAKDTNFLGSLETMNADFNFSLETNKDGDFDKAKGGFAFDFDYPFKLGSLDAMWLNSVDVNYAIGDSSPDWNLMTGLKLTKHFQKFDIVNQFKQYFIRLIDYDLEDDDGVTHTLDNVTYFTEEYTFSVPIVIQEIQNWGKVYYTPVISASTNWNTDSDSSYYDDILLTTDLTFSQTLSTGRVNWIENFRDGISASITQSYGYCISNYSFNPGISGELIIYRALHLPFGSHTLDFGFSTDIYAFAYMNGYSNFGSRLRGIADDQYYDEDEYPELVNMKSVSSKGALVVNLDFPIKLGRIYWENVPVIKKLSFARHFDMEVQISPFIDFALMKNKATESVFNPRDGFLAGGLEGIIYPLKWKGLQVRGSLGIDLSRKMPKLKSRFNQDWRDTSVKSYEISIGIGLLY